MGWKEKLYTISTGFSTTLWRIWGQTMILRRFYMARKNKEEKISGAKGYIIRIEAKKQAEMACLPPSGRDRRPGTQKDTHTWSGSAAQCVGVKRILPEEGAPLLSQCNVPGGVGVEVQAGRAAGLPLVVSLAADHGGVVFPMKHGFMGAPPI